MFRHLTVEAVGWQYGTERSFKAASESEEGFYEGSSSTYFATQRERR